MPAINVILYQEDNGQTPLITWIKELRHPGANAKCAATIKLLRVFGPKLRRPYSDFLRDGIRELRVRSGHVQLRLLYFFAGKDAVISHGVIKRGACVPNQEIDLAIARRDQYLENPARHSNRGEFS